jgi:cytochrome b involved in lipid metabolism
MSNDVDCTAYSKNEEQPWLLLTETTHEAPTVKTDLAKSLPVSKFDENMDKTDIANDPAKPQQRPEETRRYTTLEIAEHRTTTDMWLVINGEVFDVTLFQHEHPGGSKSMLAVIKKTATHS